MLYEVITRVRQGLARIFCHVDLRRHWNPTSRKFEAPERSAPLERPVITSYSIHYTKLYDVTAREKKREALRALRHERQEVSEWYGGMRHSSAEAWEDVKKGFAQSYDRMEDAFKDAAKNFKKEK